MAVKQLVTGLPRSGWRGEPNCFKKPNAISGVALWRLPGVAGLDRAQGTITASKKDDPICSYLHRIADCRGGQRARTNDLAELRRSPVLVTGELVVLRWTRLRRLRRRACGRPGWAIRPRAALANHQPARHLARTKSPRFSEPTAGILRHRIRRPRRPLEQVD